MTVRRFFLLAVVLFVAVVVPLRIDFAGGKPSAAGDQFGKGKKR